MNRKTLLAGAVLALATTTSFAVEGIRPLVGITLTGGGETLLKVRFDDNSTQRISSGGLVHLFAGAEYRAPESALTVQATVGYHVDDINADNGDASFSRVPFELLGFWNTSDTLRFGGGVRKATNSKFRSSGAAEVGDINMRTSLGVILQAEYLFGEHASVFVRYVHEDYKSNHLEGGEVSGDHGGIGMSYRF